MRTGEEEMTAFIRILSWTAWTLVSAAGTYYIVGYLTGRL